MRLMLLASIIIGAVGSVGLSVMTTQAQKIPLITGVVAGFAVVLACFV